MGRFEPAGARRTGRSRPEVAHCYHAGQLSHALLTLAAAPAAELDVGLMVLAERTPVDGDRPQPLHFRPLQREADGQRIVGCGAAVDPTPWPRRRAR